VEASDAPARGLIYCFANQKGGVGKTTTTVNLAAYLAAGGYRVLLVDADSQANATSSLGVDKQRDEPSIYDILLSEPGDEVTPDEAIVKIDRPAFNANLDLLPSSVELAGAEVELATEQQGGREFRLKKALDPLRARYDYVLVDCPPSLGLLTLNALVAVDAVLIPLNCEYFALEGIAELLATLDRVRSVLNPSLEVEGVLLTMYDDRTNLGQQVSSNIREFFGDKVYKTVIPRNVRLGEAPSHGVPVILYDARSRGAEAYVALAHEFIARAAGRATPASTPPAPSAAPAASDA
jgi:chromosome partitioning protein